MKEIANIPFTELPSIPQLIRDFLQDELPGAEKYRFELNRIPAQIAQKNFSTDKRKVLAKVLHAQYEGIRLSEKQEEHLRALSAENTFTVTTGHQLNLFTGPVYFIYKIVQTIKLADTLTKEFPQYRFVPLFWLASEDHDFEEINHFKTKQNTYSTAGTAGNAVGRLEVTDFSFISEFKKELKDTRFENELLEMAKQAYHPGQTFTDATRSLVQHLFADYGLLALDGDSPLLKQQMLETFARELQEGLLEKTTAAAVENLSNRYGKVQVNPRDINLFYLQEGQRRRLTKFNGRFVVVDSEISFSNEEILAELQLHPERFSPNAVLRPAYQETVLPNLVYIGGNAEIMYWLELPAFFEVLELPFPLLLPRDSFLMLTEKIQNRAEKLGLRTEDFFRNREEVIAGQLLELHPIAAVLDAQEAALVEQFEDLANLTAMTDVTFGTLVEAERARQLKSFVRMRKRLRRAEKIRQQDRVQRLQTIFSEVHPDNSWQERQWNFSVFYRDLGSGWLKACYDAVEIGKTQLIIFSV